MLVLILEPTRDASKKVFRLSIVGTQKQWIISFTCTGSVTEMVAYGSVTLSDDRLAWDCPANEALIEVLSSTVCCLMISLRLFFGNPVFTTSEIVVDIVSERALMSKDTKPVLFIHV